MKPAGESNVDRIFKNSQAVVGLVIGTFAAVPYVHLALESWRRNYPEIPVLVNDDGSPKGEELHTLCDRYGANFVSNSERLRRTVGDMSAYVHGLDWAAQRGLELLVKMSRRFIPIHNWVTGLQCLADESQYATYSNQCRHFNYGFRTECVGFHVETWCGSGALHKMREVVFRNQPTFVEGYIHKLARDIQKANCGANWEYEQIHPRPSGADAYGVWSIMADKRTTQKPDVLWHDYSKPLDYCRAALLYGLVMSTQDFADPNQGYGLGPQ